MHTGPLADPVRSLAAASTGEVVLVRRILFGALRGLCADLGIREGDVITCRAGTPSHLLLQTASGRTIALERDWTRFIQVSSPARAEAAPSSRAPDSAAVV